MQSRMGQPLDLVDEVLCRHLAAAAVRKVGDRTRVVRHLEIVHEGRVGLVAHALANADGVFGGGDRIRRRIRRQGLARGVEQPQPRHLGGGAGFEFVRALQIMELQRRFVDLVGEGRFVLAVGLHRIEMLGAIDKGRIQHRRIGALARVRVVPDLAAAGGKRRQQAGQQEPQGRVGMHPASVSSARRPCIRAAVCRDRGRPAGRRAVKTAWRGMPPRRRRLDVRRLATRFHALSGEFRWPAIRYNARFADLEKNRWVSWPENAF